MPTEPTGNHIVDHMHLEPAGPNIEGREGKRVKDTVGDGVIKQVAVVFVIDFDILLMLNDGNVDDALIQA